MLSPVYRLYVSAISRYLLNVHYLLLYVIVDVSLSLSLIPVPFLSMSYFPFISYLIFLSPAYYASTSPFPSTSYYRSRFPSLLSPVTLYISFPAHFHLPLYLLAFHFLSPVYFSYFLLTTFPLLPSHHVSLPCYLQSRLPLLASSSLSPTSYVATSPFPCISCYPSRPPSFQSLITLYNTPSSSPPSSPVTCHSSIS